MTMDAMKLIVKQLLPKSSIKNAKSPIAELTATFSERVDAIN